MIRYFYLLFLLFIFSNFGFSQKNWHLGFKGGTHLQATWINKTPKKKLSLAPLPSYYFGAVFNRKFVGRLDMSVEANISRNISLWRAYHRKYAPVNGVSVLSDEINRIVEHDFMTLNVPIVLGWQKKNSKIRWEGGFVIHHLLKNDTYDEKFIIEYVDVVYTWDPVGSELVELDPPRQFTRLGTSYGKNNPLRACFGSGLGID